MEPRLALIIISALVAEVCFAQPKPFVAWLVSPADSNGASIEVWPTLNNKRAFVWRLLSSGGTLLAEMKQPALPSGYTVNYGECKINGVLRQDVIAIVRHAEQREWSSDLRGFWFADEKARAFIKAQPKQVQCRNEGYGV
jgi:hypothetical protein